MRIGLEANDRWLDILVDDDGPGLPDQPLEKLLEPFFTTKSPGEGTGLGLAIVQTVAQEHGASLQLTRSDLGGCRACLRLPLPAPNPAEEADDAA